MFSAFSLPRFLLFLVLLAGAGAPAHAVDVLMADALGGFGPTCQLASPEMFEAPGLLVEAVPAPSAAATPAPRAKVAKVAKVTKVKSAKKKGRAARKRATRAKAVAQHGRPAAQRAVAPAKAKVVSRGSVRGVSVKAMRERAARVKRQKHSARRKGQAPARAKPVVAAAQPVKGSALGKAKPTKRTWKARKRSRAARAAPTLPAAIVAVPAPQRPRMKAHAPPEPKKNILYAVEPARLVVPAGAPWPEAPPRAEYPHERRFVQPGARAPPVWARRAAQMLGDSVGSSMAERRPVLVAPLALGDSAPKNARLSLRISREPRVGVQVSLQLRLL